MSKLRKILTSRITLILAVLMLIPGFVYLSAAAVTQETVNTSDDVVLREMVCRIKNATTGLYLDSYKFTLKTDGKSYLEKYSEDSLGQIFHLSPCEDGTYMIVPQNDNGEYTYSYSNESSTKANGYIQKVKLSSAGDYTKFDIVEHGKNTFIIAPSNFADSKAVLTQSVTVTKYKDFYTELQPLSESKDNQLWIIEPIKTENLSVVFTNTKVRLYTTGTFYARKLPYNVFTDDIIWTSSNDEILMVGQDGTWCALSLGTVKVTASVEGISKTFNVTVTDKDAFTWYSQNNVYTSDWDATQLLSLYFKDGGYKKKFAIDAKAPGANYAWIDEGCGNCSVAMILNNMGAVKTNGYDFRSGQNGNLIADPYTVALANAASQGPSSANTTLSGNPIYMRWDSVARQFEVGGKQLTYKRVYTFSQSSALKTIRNLLSEHPEGVIVQVERGSKNHYLVFTECLNPEEKSTSKLKFIVYDPAAYEPVNGENVLFEQSTSYLYEYYRYSHIRSVAYFTFAEN